MALVIGANTGKIYESLCKALTNELCSINCEVVSPRSTAFLKVIVYSDKKLKDKLNHQILTTIIKYTKNKQRFAHALL